MITTKLKNVSLLKVLSILSVMVLLVLIILPQKIQTAYAETSSLQGTVITSNLNVRDAANISSKIIGVVHQGDTLSIIQSKNNWNQIKLSNNETGWVHSSYITPTEKNIDATVEAVVLNVRENPNLTSKVVEKLKLGTNITVIEEQDGWAKMISASGVHGWVYENYITKEAPKAQQVTATPTEFIPNSPEPLRGRTIVLDPGHGGIDNGTTSIVRTPEKTLTLETAKAVEQKLKNAGANVIMTRTNDTYISLQQRAETSNQNHADAFISFHYNWSNDPLVNGLTDFYYQKSKDNTLASDILGEVVKSTGLTNLGTRFNDLSVLRNNLQPSTLIELGFVSNKQDDSIVESPAFHENVAQGVYLGLLDFFSNENSEY